MPQSVAFSASDLPFASLKVRVDVAIKCRLAAPVGASSADYQGCAARLTEKNDPSRGGQGEDQMGCSIVFGDQITIKASVGYISTLQNPLLENARLIALASAEISKPFATCCVFEVQRPYYDAASYDGTEDKSLGSELTSHKKCRLRHVGTGLFLKFDPTNNECPVSLEHSGLIDPSRPELGFRNDSQMVFSVSPRLKSHTSLGIKESAQVQIFDVTGRCLLTLVTHGGSVSIQAGAENALAAGTKPGVFRISVFRKYSDSHRNTLCIGQVRCMFVCVLCVL